ncbi:hypothetical protein EW146_g7192 [Bondarzewia mesenterica]|uniref:Uncharacterized protein n=1 Tax=Bondarzewia mesenterica TaxID=1095465 RepID=A0A4S4LS47_9AGAM|nr:hypothetical protein EW146_g7192 [Bondarzewia mesenterica]
MPSAHKRPEQLIRHQSLAPPRALSPSMIATESQSTPAQADLKKKRMDAEYKENGDGEGGGMSQRPKTLGAFAAGSSH